MSVDSCYPLMLAEWVQVFPTHGPSDVRTERRSAQEHRTVHGRSEECLGMSRNVTSCSTPLLADSSQTAALSLAAQQTFYAPLTSLAFQFLQLATEAEADGSSARVFDVYHRTPTTNGHSESYASQIPKTPQRPSKIGCIGLGNMGYGMANGKSELLR